VNEHPPFPEIVRPCGKKKLIWLLNIVITVLGWMER
jgi:hypothetical protein